jgi:exodeoxyribonuclease VIII
MTLPTETGTYRMPFTEYERIARVNWSTLRHLKRSPRHYAAALQQPRTEDTDAMRLGRAIHAALLEPEVFAGQWTVWDGGRRYGAKWDKFSADAEAKGLQVLTEDQYQTCRAVTTATAANEHAARHLRHGATELAVLWTHEQPANGVPGFRIDCKARIDLAAQSGALVDLKTCRDASPDAFARACWNMDYLGQAAMYVDGYAAAKGEVRPYIMVAVETSEPYVTQVYRVPERLLEMGRATYQGLLGRLHECREQNAWPGYADGELDLELPRWVQRASDMDPTGMGLVIEEEQQHA